MITEMILIPAGEFLMGSPENEVGHFHDEGPRHIVKIPAFELGRYPVTFAEYDVFCAATIREKSDDCGWGRDRHPVINLTWYDAVAYTNWLSKQTGKTYRLPTEAEWEYAARAGTATPFYFGETISTDQANYDGNSVYGKGSKGVYRQKTVEVCKFPPNSWNLYDMHGNVCEWVQDCYHDNYEDAPTDGSAYESDNCQFRVLRGGSWLDAPKRLRTVARHFGTPSFRRRDWGFRLARTLP